MGLSPLTGDLVTAARTFHMPELEHSFGVALPGPPLRQGRSHGPPAAPGSVVAESKEKSDLFLSASQGYASNVKGEGVQLIQKADLSHFTDAKTEFLPT